MNRINQSTKWMSQGWHVLVILSLIFISFDASAQTNNWFGNCLGSGNSISSGDYNTVYGDSSGFNLGMGSRNSIFGGRAGFNLTSGNDNTLIGYETGYSLMTTSGNVFIGTRCGRNTTTGNRNVFIGNESGMNNTIGRYNVFVGEESGENNTEGERNVFIGEDAGFSNTTADNNTFIGSAAGRSNITGYRNTAIGNDAGYDLRYGHHNTCLGDSAGMDMGALYSSLADAASYNTMVGSGAGAATENTSYNTFVGSYAGYDNNRTNSSTNDKAWRNTALGAYAGYTNREGSDNLYLGYKADVYRPGASALAHGNVIIGSGAHTDANYRDYNVIVGANTGVNGDYSIAIGYANTFVGNNSAYFGNPSTGAVSGPVNITVTSDARFKTNVQENVPGLEFLLHLRPVTYQFHIDSLAGAYQHPNLNPTRGFIRYSGFLAQEVDSVAQKIGYTFSGVDKQNSNTGIYGLRYAEFVPSLVKAHQELAKVDRSQQQQLEEYARRISALQARINQLKGGQSD